MPGIDPMLWANQRIQELEKEQDALKARLKDFGDHHERMMGLPCASCASMKARLALIAEKTKTDPAEGPELRARAEFVYRVATGLLDPGPSAPDNITTTDRRDGGEEEVSK